MIGEILLENQTYDSIRNLTMIYSIQKELSLDNTKTYL